MGKAIKIKGLPGNSHLREQSEGFFEQWQSAIEQLGALSIEPEFRKVVLPLFCCSEFIAKTALARPELVYRLLALDALRTPFEVARLDAAASQLAAADDEVAFMAQLRQLRQSEMVRIAARDLLGWADLAETLSALSDLADFCLLQAHQKAYEELVNRYGIPANSCGEAQSLIVLAMGKLGGRELNFSSDIDLIFAYPENGSTLVKASDQSCIDNQRFFTLQAQRVVKYLHEITADGFVFRVDTRLRPFGGSGALVVSFDFMESYYQSQGRDWERYAMVKARPVCGASQQAEELLQILRPFVYRRYLDYSAFAALRNMKAMIEREVQKKGLANDIKLGAGGIREIEFCAQAFQLIRGGRNPNLQCREVEQVLRRLANHGYLDFEIAEQLSLAYQFLRDTENRLQMVSDQQVHSLPDTPIEQSRLAYAMGFKEWSGFLTELDLHRQAVQLCFAQILFGTGPENDESDSTALSLLNLLEGKLSSVEAVMLLDEIGFAGSAAVLEEVQRFSKGHAIHQVSELGRSRLTKLLPMLFRMVVDCRQSPERVLARVLAVLEAIIQRSVYIVLLYENPSALQQLVKLCAGSGWIAQYLSEQPILLDLLLDPRLLYRLYSRAEMAEQLHDELAVLAHDDIERQMTVLRHFKQEHILRVAAVDVNDELPLMQVSDQLTWLAEVILTQVHELAFAELVAKYGRPMTQPTAEFGGERHEPELVVIGYGKLGSIELSYSSDLDLVFIHNSAGTHQQTDGVRPVSNQVFFMRLAQRMMHILNTQMPGGVLYEVDVRLRPDGASGLLVNSVQGFADYARNRAWIWEHQALVRTRILVGSENIRAEFNTLRAEILTQARNIAELRAAVKSMRARMRSELDKSGRNGFDLKQGYGGIADIEFIVQFGVLAWSVDHPDLTVYPDNIRILEQFAVVGLLSAEASRALIDAYKHLRAQVHRLALQGHMPILQDIGESQAHIDRVATIWSEVLPDD